jgi:hypothetical protein
LSLGDVVLYLPSYRKCNPFNCPKKYAPDTDMSTALAR